MKGEPKDLRERSLQSLAWLLVGLPLFGLASMLFPAASESYFMYIAGLAGINVILAVSLHIVCGLTGQFSLGHAGFMAVGGYTAAIFGTKVISQYKLMFISEPISDVILFFFATLLGGAAAGLAGLFVGLPSLRLRGDYLAIVTLGFAEIIRVVIENMEVLGAATGLVGIPRLANLYWVFFWAAATLLYAKRLHESSHGRALLAIREDEIAAEAMGVDTTGYKVRAFVASSFFAGIAGALLGYYLTILTPRDFIFLRSVEVVVMVVLGGMGSASGAVLAALVLTALPELLRPLREHTGVDLRMVIYASLLLTMMLLRPKGIFGRREVWDPRFWRRRPAPRPEVAP